MTAAFDLSLKFLNKVISQSPEFISNMIGKLPIKDSSIRLVHLPMTFFSDWIDLDHYASSLPKISTVVEWLKALKGRHLGYIDTNSNKVVLHGPVTVIPKMGLVKKIIFGTAITLTQSALVGFISYNAFNAIATYFSNQQQKLEGKTDKQPLDKASKKTVQVIAGILSALTAIAVGRAAYNTFTLSPGIYGNNGFHFIYPS